MKKNNLSTHKIKRTISPLVVILLVVLMIYTVSLLAPLAWGLLTSLKDDNDFRNNLFGLPEQWRFDNYAYAWRNFFVEVETAVGTTRKVYMPEMFFNSFLYALGCSFTATFTPCLAAYMTTKFPYKFSKIITYIVIFCMIIPIVGSLPSELQLAKSLGLYNQIWGLWIMKANFLGMYFLVFQAAFKGFPKDYAEAAKIDGASNLAIFFKIMLPLVKTTFLTVMLLQFIGFWNDYQTPLIFMPDKPTIAYGMFLFDRKTDTLLSTIPIKISGAMLMLMPILILFLTTNKRLMKNLTMGGLKG